MPINPVEKSPTERSLTIPPPIGGWNTKEPLSEMDPRYSPGLENFFPGNGAVELRNGYTQHVKSTGLGVGYYHLDELVNSAGTHFLIAFTGGGGVLYNVTSAGAGTAITGGFTTLSTENYSVNYRGRLYCKGYQNAAGSDILSTDGTAATLPAFTGPGAEDQNLWRLATYKGRLYALQITNASMWYSGLDAITGAMTEFDFQSLLNKGSKPWYIGGFSMTGGDITQEYFCMISEQGEVFLYQGDYPGAVSWALVSHFLIPAPVGRKSFFNWGSDILIITYDGLVSLKDYIGTPVGEDYTFLSDNISNEFKAYIDDAVSVSGTQNQISGIVYPKGQYLLVNFIGINLIGTITCTQLVMNTRLRAWTKFTGQNGHVWCLLNNKLYWAGGVPFPTLDGYVALADNGYKDVDPSNSALTLTRTIKCRHAFNYFGDPTTEKIFTQAQPVMYQSEGMDITANIDVDYSNDTAISTETDTSKGTSYQLYNPKLSLTNANNYYGTAGSFRIDGTVTEKRFRLEATKITWSEG